MRPCVQTPLRLLLTTLLMYLFLVVQCVDEDKFLRESRGLCSHYNLLKFNFPSMIECSARCMSDDLCIGFCFKESCASECIIYALNKFTPSAFIHGHRTYNCTSSIKDKNGATEFCDSYGASLFVPLNEHENEVSKMAPGLKILIGINDQANEGTWVLDENNSPISFTNWDSGEPDNRWGPEGCAFAHTDTGRWDDVYCYRKFGVCCQSPSAGECPNAPFGDGEPEGEECFIKKVCA